MAGLDLVHGGDDRVDVQDRLFVSAGRRVLKQRRMAVLGDQISLSGSKRRAQLAHLGEPGERLLDVLDDRLEGRILRGQGLRLDEHHLALHLDVLAVLVEVEARVVDDPIGGAGLADVRVVLVDALGADLHAQEGSDDDEREPAEDGCLPVARAPATHPGREVLRVLER